MAWWKQAVLVLLLGIAAVVGWAVFVPSARPFLAQYGVLAPLERIGLIASAPETATETGASRGGPQRGGVRVVAEPVRVLAMNDRITAVGTARGVRSATLAAEIPGRIAQLNVSSGEYVSAGTTIVRLDSEAAQIAVDRAELVAANEKRNFDRLTRLQTSGAATELQLLEADLAVKSADLELQEAAFELSRHRIIAPVAGWVGILEVEPGDLVSSGTNITVLEDRSTLLVDFRVPERVASVLRTGDPVAATALADPGQVLEGTVSALDNRVDEASRSLRVQAALPNEGDRLRPGMAISLTLELEGESWPAVDPLAIQWGAEGAYVWVLRDGKAARLPVRIRQRNADMVLVDAEFADGDLVVNEGVMALRPGVEAVAHDAPSGEAAATTPDATKG